MTARFQATALCSIVHFSSCKEMTAESTIGICLIQTPHLTISVPQSIQPRGNHFPINHLHLRLSLFLTPRLHIFRPQRVPTKIARRARVRPAKPHPPLALHDLRGPGVSEMSVDIRNLDAPSYAQDSVDVGFALVAHKGEPGRHAARYFVVVAVFEADFFAVGVLPAGVVG